MSKSKKYNLRIDEFDLVIKDYIESKNNNLSIVSESTKRGIIYRFFENGYKKAISILHCYISKGSVSFYCEGKNKNIAEECMYLLIENTEIQIGEMKVFVVKEVSKSDCEAIISFLATECECNVVEPALQDKKRYCCKITGRMGDIITVTHYNTETLMVQGRPSLTFCDFVGIATELLNPLEVKKEHFRMFGVTAKEIIDTSLQSHLPHVDNTIVTKLDGVMSPSLILLNSSLQLPDYSAYAFPVLKGAEGVLKQLFAEREAPIGKDGFGAYFRNNKWIEPRDSIFPEESRKKVLDLYNYYHKHRHTTFHSDVTIETTRTLNHDEAFEIVTECLRLIDTVYLN